MRIAGLFSIVMILCAGLGCSRKSQKSQMSPATQSAPSASQLATPSEISAQLLQTIRAVSTGAKPIDDGAKEIAPLFSEGFKSDIKGYENSPKGFLQWFAIAPTTQPADANIPFAGTLKQFEGSKWEGTLGELRLIEKKYSLSERDVYVLINNGHDLWVFRSEPAGWKLILALK